MVSVSVDPYLNVSVIVNELAVSALEVTVPTIISPLLLFVYPQKYRVF